jgi:hypothetical protein
MACAIAANCRHGASLAIRLVAEEEGAQSPSETTENPTERAVADGSLSSSCAATPSTAEE